MVLTSSPLPPDFLVGSSPKLTVTPIDFSQTPVKYYAGLYAVVIDNAFSASECADLVRIAETRAAGKWQRAMIDAGYGEQKLDTMVRSCGRIICDDRELAGRIWARVKDAVPEIHVLQDWPDWADVTGEGICEREEVWKMTRLNERMRFLKYGAGEYFRPHCDGLYTTPDGQETSFFTLHLYLNESNPDTPGGILEGGATSFHWYDFEERDDFDEVESRLDVAPKIGRVLIFQQRELLHSGDDVTAGTKLTMRTDLMYQKVGY